ncbi:MAG: DoxX family protein [Gemmatimonadales bacterium]|nr:DoxX family protein [Gemmatimonadales bacterium]MYG50318.1 DoxX family protein [Gemmatimonadales bacterium]MYK00630.1 DoxX family protein [Candidatus Palauibacter ramosifaciens]
MAGNGTSGKAVNVVSILLALLFLLNGGMKIAGMMVDQFAVWGYPAWFQYLIGVAEALAGVGFLRRPTRFLAAVIVVPIMAGAIYTLVRAGTAPQAAMPAVALLLGLFVAKKSR